MNVRPSEPMTRPMRRAVTALGAACLAVWAPMVQAQAPDVRLAPSAAIECMTPAPALRGVPVYPEGMLEHGESARVLVELVFDRPDSTPELKVLESQGRSEFIAAVKDHVTRFRIPCAAAADLPVRLQQEYVFRPDGRKVHWTTPTDLGDAARSRVLKCMAAKDGSKHPQYPTWARHAGAQGRVLAKLRFTGPDLPPEVTVHAASRAVKLLATQTVQPWAERLRLPCIEGFAVESFVEFVFMLEGEAPFGFRNTGFVSFLRMAKNLEQPGAVFDTQSMGCPFDVALDYLQPYFPNRVGELEAAQPSRRPLLEWLSTLVLDLKPAEQDAVAGDTANFTVPCMKIDFNPKEKSS